MRILVDILHPAHVHFFRNAIQDWRRRHEILVTSRKKDLTIPLLDAYSIPHTIISSQQPTMLGLGWELVERDLSLLRLVRGFNPDVLTGVGGICASHVGILKRKPSIVFYDTEDARLINALTHPFATTVCTPDCYSVKVRGNHIRYSGFHELAYLHPKRFQRELSAISQLSSEPRTYGVVRFVSHNSSHDSDGSGMSLKQKCDLVSELNKISRVFISSEPELPRELKRFELPTPPEAFHQVMAHASFVVGESATVCSEAAMLGVPSVYISEAHRGYIDELSDRYRLVFKLGLQDFPQALAKLRIFLSGANLLEQTETLCAAMLRDKIDVTNFVVKTIEGLSANPQSRESELNERKVG